MIKIYAARAMSNRDQSTVVKEAKLDKRFFEACGLTVLDPVAAEGVKAIHKTLLSSKQQMTTFWPRDKQMIREAHLIFDLTPHLNSEGTKHEIGYGRYCLWKPVVRIFPTGKLPADSSVAYFEDDYVCDSLIEAVEYAYRVHGTFLRRLMWRLKLLNRCVPKWIMHQIMEIK